MERRGFLSLLAAAPFLPTLAEAVIEQAPVAPAPNLRLVTCVRVLPFGCDPRVGTTNFVVPAGGVARFVACPQLPFRPERLMISNHHNPGPDELELLNVAQNGEPQLELDGVPTSVFSPYAIGTRLEFQTASPGVEIVLAVLNRNSVPVPFQAAMIGRSFSWEEEREDVAILGPDGLRIEFGPDDDFEEDFDEELDQHFS